MAEIYQSSDSTGEKFLNEELLEDLYSKGEVFEEEKKVMRLWMPRIPPTSIAYGSEELVLRGFRRKVSCLEYEEPYFRKIHEDAVYAGYKEVCDFDLFFEACRKSRSLCCDTLQSIISLLIGQRCKLKNLELKLISIYSGLQKDNQNTEKRMRILIKDSIGRVRRAINQILTLQASLSAVVAKSEDMYSFLKRASVVKNKRNVLME